MEMILSHVSALQFLRTPPVVHQMYGSYPDISSRSAKRALIRAPAPYGSISLPLHVLVANPSEAYRGRSYMTHTWSMPMPPEALIDTEYGVTVTSPLFTIQCLSPRLSIAQVTMLLYEMAGTFSVYRPVSRIRSCLQRLVDAGRLPSVGGWRPMIGLDGQLRDLWRRPPLVELADLNRHIVAASGLYGAKRLASGARDVHGVAASPFEVQVAMLLGLPRARGGFGLGPFEHNKRIAFSGRARTLSDKGVCYGDLYVEGVQGHQPVLIECQGSAYHGLSNASSDDNRAMALQSMGITVVRLRQEQIVNPRRLSSTAGFIAELLGKSAVPHTAKQGKKAARLHADVLADWWEIGA